MGINITIISDNNPSVKGLETSWGFSCLIGTGKENILFDTGCCGAILLSNMKKMNIDPKDVDIVFISHSHWDHAGGLFDFLKVNNKVKVYVTKTFSEKFVGQIKQLGAKVVRIDRKKKISSLVYSSGELGTKIREQALVLKTDDGSMLITGCAHPGILEILKSISVDDNVSSILGGFHLAEMKDEQIISIADNMISLGVKKVFPTHCTGAKQSALLSKKFNMPKKKLGAGFKIMIERR